MAGYRQPVAIEPQQRANCLLRSNREPQITLQLTFPGKALVFRMNEILAVISFQATNRKMATRDGLEVLNKCIIHRGASESTDDWYCLSRRFLRYDHPKPRTDLRDQPH